MCLDVAAPSDPRFVLWTRRPVCERWTLTLVSVLRANLEILAIRASRDLRDREDCRSVP